jgi:hypothetical protein
VTVTSQLYYDQIEFALKFLAHNKYNLQPYDATDGEVLKTIFLVLNFALLSFYEVDDIIDLKIAGRIRNFYRKKAILKQND